MTYAVFNGGAVIPVELARKATEENVRRYVEDELNGALKQCSIRKVEITSLPDETRDWPDVRFELEGPDEATLLREFRDYYDWFLEPNDIKEFCLESIRE